MHKSFCCNLKELQLGGVGENNVFWFVFIVKFLSELNAKQGMDTLELKWKKIELSKA
jgi:hypothetical protein